MATAALAAASAANDYNAFEGAGEDEKVAFGVNERNSLEVVIALTGPVGSGVSTVSDIICQRLVNDFGYTPFYIKVSDLIKEHASEVGVDLNATLSPSQRIDSYQTAGNSLRERKATYLADRVIERINALRRDNKGVLEQVNAPDIPTQNRFAYVIDSLKNPAEVSRLRQIYGGLFWHVTVFAPDQVREKRLVDNGIEDDTVKHIMNRDEEEGLKAGQQVSKTAHMADYFIRNHTDVVENVEPAVLRLLDGIFGTKLLTPKQDETGMMKAASAAVQSACMSRQVGAAVYDAAGELIGVGCNDVPKSGGGLYSSEMTDLEDKRCYRWGGKKCHNDDRKQEMTKKIAKEFADESDQENFERVIDKVASSGPKSLIEFSRSVHAEMEAIVSVARHGKGSTVDGALYTTTFPCHNCARHIVAAGIARVVFIEPYSKSLALDLHNDSITLTDEPQKVQFQQYEGFAPRSSLRVFSSIGRDRKGTDGKVIEVARRGASPLFPHPLDSYMTSEELVIRELARL